ncbi:MAG TPA: hypothetical protein PKA88_40045, partial [Polyangiaceae bacterium]|nr:hypothetical protein [Polyangiaceae bacterium]
MLAIRVRLASFWVGGLLLGCTLDDVDLRGKECPCTGGYVCDTSSGLCVPFLVEGGVAGAGGSAAAAGASGSSGSPSG